MKLLGTLLSLASLLFITACSSGGGASTAEITADNVVDLAVAGTEAAKSAADSDDIFAFKSGSSTGFNVEDFSKQVAQILYATQDLSSYLCTCPQLGQCGALSEIGRVQFGHEIII